jgi:hypothetical protein
VSGALEPYDFCVLSVGDFIRIDSPVQATFSVFLDQPDGSVEVLAYQIPILPDHVVAFPVIKKGDGYLQRVTVSHPGVTVHPSRSED